MTRRKEKFTGGKLTVNGRNKKKIVMYIGSPFTTKSLSKNQPKQIENILLKEKNRVISIAGNQNITKTLRRERTKEIMQT